MELIPADIGRPVNHLAHNFDGGDVAEDVDGVLKSLTPARAEMRTKSDRWYVRQTLPYRTADDRIGGVVITFNDITGNKRAEQELRAQRDYAEHIVHTMMRRPLLILDSALMVKSANAAFCEVFHVAPAETIGKRVYDLGSGQWNIPDHRKLLEEVLPDNDALTDYEVTYDFPTLGPRTMLLNARRLDELQTIVLDFEDVTERKRADEHREMLIAELNHRVKNSLMTVQAITNQTLRYSETMEDFRDSLQGQALAHGYDLLNAISWRPPILARLVEEVAAPYEGEQRKRVVTKDCDGVRFRAQSAIALVMMLHELATNSAKYGALSVAHGRVEVACKMNEERARFV